MKKFRIEEDFLGIREIPQDAYYGIQTVRAMENFPITGYRVSADLIGGLAVVKKAAAKANRGVGLLSTTLCDAIVYGAQQVMEGGYQNQFLVDPIQGGAGTSVNMNVNEVVANLALEHLGKDLGDYQTISPNTHVNMAQSTNDAFPTGAHIGLIRGAQRLLKVLEALQESFAQKGQEFDPIIKMGRTHLQDAVPIRLGQEFAAYGSVLQRDIKRISLAMDELYEVNIGATAVGTGLNADPQYIEKTIAYLREETNLPLVGAKNLVDGTQSTDIYTALSSTLKICMLNLSKIANDLRLMASGPRTGLFEINLPPRQPGSSIMPGKVNPVMAELVSQIAFQVAGNDLTISMASEAGQLELNVMEPVLFFNLFQSLEIMANGLDSFNKFCVVGITANQERARDFVDNSVGIITAVNPHIGYEKSSILAKEALNTGEKVSDLALKNGFLTKEELAIILDPYEMTNIGISGKELLEK